mgnify:CR=1 FL=1
MLQSRPLSDLHVANLLSVDDESQGAADLVESVASGGSRIEVKQVVNGVVDHLQNMGVSGDEQFGTDGLDAGYDFGGVVAGIASDVGHQHAHPLAVETEEFGIDPPHDAAVDVAVDGPQGFEGGDLVGYLDRTDVSGVPDLVDSLQECAERIVEGAVGIRYEADAFHDRQ